MSHSSIPPRTVESAEKKRDVCAAEPAAATPTENWIVQQEFEDDEAVNRESGDSERGRRGSLWLD
ncbi:hypothetical protein [Aureimonas pseudogalii]|uniref:Uncharacterized protein n=1 Tax=Aureimonas pseudogalii TaxID=1744844 RepID=A0A7W6H655_9HYPH|nr:hypothetical protein [Aureimonas pseudogalii]MBB3999290.1 hypothetical protein [Aureimonas pseudogalii]